MKQIRLMLLLVLVPAVCGGAAELPKDGSITLTADFTYQMGTGDSEVLAKTLALFSAKLKAVVLASKYLTHKGVLPHYEKRQNEILYLTPKEITAAIVDEKFDSGSQSYYVKIRCDISSLDFIRAEIEDAALQKNESSFSFDREMEQPVASEMEPGKELSRAYRYIRKGEWRVAIIYLDHLEKKYSNWGEVFLAKAIAFYGTGDETGMMDALSTACRMGNQEACDEIKSFSKEQPWDK